MFYGMTADALTMAGQARMLHSLGEWTDLDEFLWLRCGHIHRFRWEEPDREASIRAWQYTPDWRQRRDVNEPPGVSENDD